MHIIIKIANIKKNIEVIKIKTFWGLGIGDGDWGLGIGDWAQSPIPNPQLTSSFPKY